MNVEHCRSCKADIFWAVTTARNSMPIDVDQVKGGTLELEERPGRPPLVRIVKAEPEVARYRSHFASCPDAWRWKRH
jgi:hypothetical protein